MISLRSIETMSGAASDSPSGVPGQDPVFGGDHDVVDVEVIGEVVRCGCAAADLDVVVVTYHEPIGRKVQGLFGAVGG